MPLAAAARVRPRSVNADAAVGRMLIDYLWMGLACSAMSCIWGGRLCEQFIRAQQGRLSDATGCQRHFRNVKAGNGAGPAHAAEKSLQDSDAGPVPNGGLVAALHASAKAKSAKGRGFWAVCSVLLLLLIVRSKLMGSGAGRPVAAQEPLRESA